MHFAVKHTPAEWRQMLGPQRYAVLREAATERPFTSPLLKEHRKRHVRLRRLRAAAVQLGDQVRKRHRLAELLAAAAARGRHPRRPQPDDGAHRSAVRALRRASWATSSTTARSRPACAIA